MVTWPTSFPMPQTSFDVEADTGAVSSKTDSGRRRKYSRFTTVNRTFNFSCLLDDDQYFAFQNFYEVALNNGSDWFYMPMAIGGGIQTLRVRFMEDSYKGGYQEVMHWMVMAKIETEDQNSSVENNDALELIGYDLAGYELAVERVDRFANITLNEIT